MKKIVQISTLLALFGVLLYGCDTSLSPSSELETPSSEFNNTEKNSSSDFLEMKDEDDVGAEVTVTTDYNEDEAKTTFTYTVKNVSDSDGNPILTDFTLSLPSCAGELDSFTPDGESAIYTYDANEDYNPIEWNIDINPNPSDPNNTQIYTVSYPGNVASGLIGATIEQKENEEKKYKGELTGPACQGIVNELTFSGSIYIDANEDDVKDPEEYGLENIEVKLFSVSDNDETRVASVTTEEDGLFSFTVNVDTGNFRIEVPSNKVDNIYYQATTTSEDFKDVADDIANIHFAYTLDTDQVVEDLDNGTIPKNTKSPKYWSFQLQHASVNQAQMDRNPNIDFTQQEIFDLLDSIEDLLPNVLVPFEFDGNNDKQKLNDALNILRGKKYEDDEVSELMKQLLTAELNVMSDRGAFTENDGSIELNDPFNRAILIFGEAIACKAIGSCPDPSATNSILISSATVTGTSAPGTLSNATLSDGTRTLSSFNGTGGIGGK